MNSNAKKLAITLISGAAVSLCITNPAVASLKQEQEIALLKQQLELMTRQLDQVNKRLASIEQQQAKPKPAPALSVTSSKPATTATAATTTATISPAAKSNPAEGEPVVGGSMPGSFKIPGTSTSVKIGGYAKLDAIEDVGGAYGARYANFAAIPLDTNVASRQGSQFNMHARQSRLNMETRTPTDLGELQTMLEIDFFGSATGNPNTTNGEGLQLRHAYGKLGHFLVGQTWSNFMDVDAYPESLDYIGPSGLTFVRQAQIRYTDNLNDKVSYSVAVESPSTDFTNNAGTTNPDISLNNAPDLTAKLQLKDSFGQLSLRGLARQLRAGNNAVSGGTSDGDFGWGVGLSGKINVLDKDAIFFQGVYGDGVGHYLFDVANSLNGTTYVSNRLNPQEAWGGYIGYQHYWAPHWRSNILAGYTGIDNNTAFTGMNVNKEIMSGHVNLIWNPTPSYRIGVEYMHGRRELESGVDGDLNRIQTSFWYLF